MAPQIEPPKNIVITGATSGIGAALAREYAAPGVFLALIGRNPDRLAAVAADCEKAGAEVAARTLDVTDRDALAGWLTEIDAAHPVDLLVANAGISAGTSKEDDAPDKTRDIFAVNLAGVLNTVLPMIPKLRERKRGQIALLASIAAFRGIPGTAAYCGSKAAVKVWGEGLRGELWGDGVGVSVICPGFVVSAITDANQFPMPFIMPGDRAARIIRQGLARNKARIVFPWPMHFMVWLLSLLPPAWTDPALRRARQDF